MSHNYLLELHEIINSKITDAEKKIQQSTKDQDPLAEKFHQGRADVLAEVLEYIAGNYNPKLPRKIRHKFISHN